MHPPEYSIGELAEAADLSRRAVRFYVQRELLPPPRGLGRGARYGPEHLDRLREIQELQRAGRTLDEIRAMLRDGGNRTGTRPTDPENAPPRVSPIETSAGPATNGEPPAALPATDTWVRIPLATDVELHVAVDAAAGCTPLDAAQVRAVRDLVRRQLASRTEPAPDGDQPGEERP